MLAILLLPFCVGAGMAFWRVLQTGGHSETIWVPALAGAACWWIVFLMLPKPMRVYVIGHELTHALWTVICGGKVIKFKAAAAGGHVVVTKNNFLIALAPYFFPLYVVLGVGCFVVGHWIWNWSAYLVWFHLLLGAAYSFHITLTWHILQTHQTDIMSQGYLFSAVVIWLGNISVLLLGIPLLTSSVSVQNSLGWWWQESVGILARLRGLFGV